MVQLRPSGSLPGKHASYDNDTLDDDISPIIIQLKYIYDEVS
jgi:hypothetical protein